MSKARFTLFDLLMWVALAALVAAVLAPMFGEGSHSGLITKLAISADGSTAAALFGDGTVRVWDVADGKRLAALPIGQNRDFALSADGKTLAATGFAGPAGYGIGLWDVATGKRLRTVPAHAIAEIAFAPNGGRLAWSSNSGTIELYEPPLESSAAVALASSPILFSPKEWTAPVFSPDGALLAVRNGKDEIVVFNVASRSIQATLEVGGNVLGAMAFSPDGRKLALLSFRINAEDDDVGNPLAIPPETSLIAFEAEQKSGQVWDFSKARRYKYHVDDVQTSGNSMAFLADGETLVTAGGFSVALIDANTGKISGLNISGFIAEINSRGSVVATSDLYRVDVYDLPDGMLRRTLWSSSTGVNPAVFMAALMVWLLVHKVRKTAKQMRHCETCGQAFVPANKRDQNVDCPKCRQHARPQTIAPSQITHAPYKRWLRMLFRPLPLMACLLLLGYLGVFSSRLLWLLLVPLLLPAWIGLLRLQWYLKRRRTANERYDVQLAEQAAAACGEIHRIGGLVVWSAGDSKMLAAFEPQIEICRQRLQTAIGDRVPPPEGARALIFADRQGMARYLAQLRLPLGGGPRFNGVYLFAPLKKMLIPEQELFEQSSDPLVRMRALILYRLLEQSDPWFRQNWLTNGLVSVLARNDGDDDLVRLGRRMKATLLADRVIGPGDFFTRRTARVLRRVRRRGDHALHAWVIGHQTQSWSLIESLCGRSATAERRAAFQRFWHDSARRRDAGAVLARNFDTSLNELLAEWRASFERQPLSDHLPPPPHMAGWMLREPLATVADVTALRRNRIVATWTLGELGYVFGADRLIGLVRGDDPLLRQEAVWALECISGEMRGMSAAGWEAWWQSVPQNAIMEQLPASRHCPA